MIHPYAILIQIRSLNFSASSHYHFIITMYATTAIIEGYKEVIISILFKNEGRFNRTLTGAIIIRFKITGTFRNGVPLLWLRNFRQACVELNQLHSTPERTKCQPS